MSACLAWIPLFFLTAGQQLENPWLARVSAAVHDAREQPTPEAYQKALDTAWRADGWPTGLELAQEALDKWPEAKELRPMQARAFWRAGRMSRAEELAAQIPANTADRVGLRLLIRISLSRGDLTEAAREGDRLAGLGSLGAEDLSSIIDVRLAQNRPAGLPEMFRQAEKLADAANGYPETYLADKLGYAEYFEQVGSAPLNQVTRFGEADMPMDPRSGLPVCQMMINGRGPYSMLLDTGASYTLWLDQAVATELGVKSILHATVNGVLGKEESTYSLVEQVTIGGINCERVRVCTYKSAGGRGGVIGTGIFGNARMTLDLAAGRLCVEPAGTEAAAGREVQARIAGDCRLLTSVLINGEPVTAMLDSGANVFGLAPSLLKRLAPDCQISKIVGADTQPSTRTLLGVDVEFGGRRFQGCGAWGVDFLDSLSAALAIQTDAIVGMPLLRDARTLTVDYPHCRMWVQWTDR